VRRARFDPALFREAAMDKEPKPLLPELLAMLYALLDGAEPVRVVLERGTGRVELTAVPAGWSAPLPHSVRGAAAVHKPFSDELVMMARWFVRANYKESRAVKVILKLTDGSTITVPVPDDGSAPPTAGGKK
jgi:hypothetical protein